MVSGFCCFSLIEIWGCVETHCDDFSVWCGFVLVSVCVRYVLVLW